MSDLELKNEILEIKAMLSLLIPKNVPLTYIAEQLGKSRQSVREFLINNFEPECLNRSIRTAGSVDIRTVN